MTVNYGILLCFIGLIITIIGLYIAYEIGSRPSKKENKSSVLFDFLN
jgi:uncharacterized membrane protein